MENMKKAGKSFEYGVEADNNPAQNGFCLLPGRMLVKMINPFLGLDTHSDKALLRGGGF
jgi:hypothetical protein